MQPRRPITTDLVLLGAGHAHVEVLRRFAMRPEPGVRLTLIGREPETPYSGMLPGLIRGDYRFGEAHIDLAPLSAAAGARLILAEATAIDLASRTADRGRAPPVLFDLLSIDVGGAAGGAEHSRAARSSRSARSSIGSPRWSAICRRARASRWSAAAPAGTELALALARRFRGRFRLVLVCDTAEPLAAAPAHARRVARAALVDAGVELVCGVRAGALRDGRLALSDGSFLDADEALWATGVVGPAFLAASGLACDDAGCVRVEADAALASAIRSCSPPATARRWRAIRGRRPASGRCAPARRWPPICAAPSAAGCRAVAAAARGAGHPGPRRRPGGGVAQRAGGVRAAGVALEGLDRSALDADVLRCAWRRHPTTDAMRCGGCGAKVGAEVLARRARRRCRVWRCRTC